MRYASTKWYGQYVVCGRRKREFGVADANIMMITSPVECASANVRGTQVCELKGLKHNSWYGGVTIEHNKTLLSCSIDQFLYKYRSPWLTSIFEGINSSLRLFRYCPDLPQTRCQTTIDKCWISQGECHLVSSKLTILDRAVHEDATAFIPCIWV